MKHTFILLSEDRFEEALNFVCKEFVKGSVLHQALGINAEEYLDYMHQPVRDMISERLSFIAVDDSDAIVACVLAGEYLPPQPGTGNDDSARTPASLQPLTALLDTLDQQYWAMRAKSSTKSDAEADSRIHLIKNTADKTLLIDIAVVSPAAQGTGLYQALRATAVEHARSRGFSRVVSELSSAATQHVCINKLGYEVISAINYASFEFNGQKPFTSITDPASIVLVERALS